MGIVGVTHTGRTQKKPSAPPKRKSRPECLHVKDVYGGERRLNCPSEAGKTLVGIAGRQKKWAFM